MRFFKLENTVINNRHLLPTYLSFLVTSHTRPSLNAEFCFSVSLSVRKSHCSEDFFRRFFHITSLCSSLCVPGMSARGSRASSVDTSLLPLLLTISISAFRLTLWHNDRHVFQSSVFFRICSLLFWLFFFSSVCGVRQHKSRAHCQTVNAWAFFLLFRPVALLGVMLHFNSFFDSRMIQMPYFHSCAKVVSAFLLHI